MYKIQEPNLSSCVVQEPFVRFSANPQKEFDCIQKFAEETKGIVMPGLNNKYLTVLKVEPHNFNSEKPLKEAQKWAEKHLVGKYTSYTDSEEFEYYISKNAIQKYLSPSATQKSTNIAIHLSVLKVLPRIINESIEVEIHANYTKVDNLRSINNPVDKYVLIHRFYGAITYLDNIYRVKTTIYEYRDVDYISKPHSFEVIKIELLDLTSNSSISASSHPYSLGGLITSTANILQNVEKSYDKGKFLLEESKKSDAWRILFKRIFS